MRRLEDIYQEFGKNLLMASLFYFPKEMLFYAKRQKLSKDIDLEPYVGRVLIFERNGDNYFIGNEPVYHHVQQKKSLLESNMFLLLQYREEFPEGTFAYILEKYTERLTGFRFAAEWLLENASNDIDALTDSQLSAFQLQHDTFVEHEEELLERFSLEQPKAKGELTEEAKKKGLEQFVGIVKQNASTQTSTREHVDEEIERSNAKADKKARMEALKEHVGVDCDRFLLETVFNVNFREKRNH